MSRNLTKQPLSSNLSESQPFATKVNVCTLSTVGIGFSWILAKKENTNQRSFSDLSGISHLCSNLKLGAADASNVYERDFDGIFLGTTQEFYQNESSLYLTENAASNYVQKAVRRLREEKGRAGALALPPTS